MSAERVLDRRTLNRTLLARQLLLERVDLPIPAAVEQLVGLQAQVPVDPYVALWSRLRDFDPDELGRLLLDRDAVRMTLLRSTIHLVTADDSLRIRPLLQELLERAFASSPFARSLEGLDPAPLLARGVELVEERPRTVAQLAAALGALWPDRDPTALAYAVRYLVPLVQVTPRGVWGKTLQATLTTQAGWLGREEPAATVDELVLRYLRAFGPASAADVRTWSGLARLRPVLDRLRPQLRVYRDEGGRELLDVADGEIGDPAAAAPVRLLPQYDNVFLSHADRGRVFDAIVWDGSFVHCGTVFVDGFLAGAWKFGRDGIEVDLRTRVDRAQRRELAVETEALRAFLTSSRRDRGGASRSAARTGARGGSGTARPP